LKIIKIEKVRRDVLRGGSPKNIEKARIRSKIPTFDVELQGEQLCGHSRLMKMFLKKVT